MNQPDAYKLLSDEMAAYRALRYGELAELVGPPKVRIVRGVDSTEYAVEVIVRWRNGERGELLVEGWIAANDCGPLHRLDESFIVPVC
jgi:hypothetical protein